MTQAKHTPGPWKIGRAKGKGTARSIWRNDAGFDESCDGNKGYALICRHVHNEANARLIAAGPDMLAALAHIADRAADPSSTENQDSIECALNFICETARAAIAKAKGFEL